MYTIDDSIQSDSGLKIIQVGIQENLKSTGIVYGPVKENGKPCLAFNFSKDDALFRHLEFPIDETRERESAERYYDILIKKGNTPNVAKPLFIDQYIKKVFKEQAARIKHILTKFIDEKNVVIPPVNTFEQYSRAIINLVGDAYKVPVLRAKIVYNNKDYPSFPRYPDFLEVQTSEPTRLQINPKYDRITRRTPDGYQQEENQDQEY